MTSFFARLQERVEAAQSLLCVGLDPHPQDLPENTPLAAAEFCQQLVRATAEQAACFKPNIAFFEALGADGIAVLREVIAAIPEDIPVILDAKRGDIASSAEAYAQAAFDYFDADAVTVNPYLGYDALEPFLRQPEKGVFLLCKTSNPGASDLQDLRLHHQAAAASTLYEYVASLTEKWNRDDNLGLVVGATDPQALAWVRAISPGLWILAPGVGAQGGDLRAALQAGLRPDGMGLLLPVSRSLSRAQDPRQAAEGLRQEINRQRAELVETRTGQPPPAYSPRNSLADALLEAGCIRFGQFTLKSGMQSPIYIDLRRLISHSELLAMVAEAYLPILRELSFDRLAALPYAAIPIATAISLKSGWPVIYPRKEVKSYGTAAEIEGEYSPGERVVVVDDLATTGGSKFEAITKLASAGLTVEDIVVLVDRQSGAKQALSQAGYRMSAVFTLTGLLDYWQGTGRVPEEQILAVREFLKAQDV